MKSKSRVSTEKNNVINLCVLLLVACVSLSFEPSVCVYIHLLSAEQCKTLSEYVSIALANCFSTSNDVRGTAVAAAENLVDYFAVNETKYV